jgi:hypothetical protein
VRQDTVGFAEIQKSLRALNPPRWDLALPGSGAPRPGGNMSQYLPMNEATIDRAIRVVLGLGLLATTVVGPQSMYGLIGLVPLITGVVGSCPLYTLFGFSTCPLPKA